MKVSVSILSSNNRIECIKKLNNTTVDYYHIDVMDGKFVNNYQMPIEEIEEMIKYTNKPLDIHLMVENPIEYLEKLNQKKILSDYLTFHLEAVKDKEFVIRKIKESGYKVGISIKPKTDIKELIPYLSIVDLVLIMSVEPGKGGQKFIPDTFKKISNLKELIKIKNSSAIIEVDGGINDTNIEALKKSGANIVVSGSYIVNQDNYQNQINKLKI